MFKEIVKNTLPAFGTVLLISTLVIAGIMGIMSLTAYLIAFYSVIGGIIAGTILFIGGFFLLMVLFEYIPAKYEQWKAKRNS